MYSVHVCFNSLGKYTAWVIGFIEQNMLSKCWHKPVDIYSWSIMLWHRSSLSSTLLLSEVHAACVDTPSVLLVWHFGSWHSGNGLHVHWSVESETLSLYLVQRWVICFQNAVRPQVFVDEFGGLVFTSGSHCDSYLGHQDICGNRVFGSIHLSVGSLECRLTCVYRSPQVVCSHSCYRGKYSNYQRIQFISFLLAWMCSLVQMAFYVTAQ